jgi:arsenate reductase
VEMSNFALQLIEMKVYHNPSCSKSRLCVDYLSNANHDFEVHNHLKNPLSASELKDLLTKLNLKPSQLVRRKEVIFKEAQKAAMLTEDEILQLMVDNPKLIERPIVEVNGNAVLARTIEALEPFLQIELNRITRK